MDAHTRTTWLRSLTLLGVFFAYYVYRVFSSPSFIQQEVLGLAFYWTQPEIDFFKSLFNPQVTDGYPGRFRYVEYLAQGLYWNAMKAGFLPKNLYDYLNMTLVFLTGLGIVAWARKQKLTLWETAVCLSLFLLTIPSFMVGVFHFRKAKIFAALFLIVVRLLLPYLDFKKPPLVMAFWGVCLLGVLSDPYFILMAPVLTFFYDLSVKNRFLTSKLLFVGLLAGGLVAFGLTGVLGSYFFENQGIHLWNIPGNKKELLSILNLPYFMNLLPDLFYPGISQSAVSGVFLFLGLLSCVWFFRKSVLRSAPDFLGFLVVIFVATFTILPDTTVNRFASYYGVAIMLFLALALGNLLAVLRLERKRKHYWGVSVLVLLVLGIHHQQRDAVFQVWKKRHFTSASVQKRWDRDYKRIDEIKTYLNRRREDCYLAAKSFYELNFIRSDLKHLSLRDIYGKDEKEEGKRSTLSYFLLPVLFHQEIQQGIVRINYK